MAHGRCASVILFAFTALHHPTRSAANVSALRGSANARRFTFRIIATVALFSCYRIASEPVPMTFATAKQNILLQCLTVHFNIKVVTMILTVGTRREDLPFL